MRRTRHDHLHGKLPCQCRSQIGRCPAIPVHPKAAAAGCLAMTSSAYNGTSAQRCLHKIGAARRDPRRGEIPMCGAHRRPVDRPSVREVVSNRTGQTTETAWAVPGPGRPRHDLCLMAEMRVLHFPSPSHIYYLHPITSYHSTRVCAIRKRI